MPMPLRNSLSDYRYAYQGQEKDSETGKEAFELRLWDARIGRWLTTDPAREFASPYLGMGNNPIRLTDPDGGSTTDYYLNLKSGSVEHHKGSADLSSIGLVKVGGDDATFGQINNYIQGILGIEKIGINSFDTSKAYFNHVFSVSKDLGSSISNTFLPVDIFAEDPLTAITQSKWTQTFKGIFGSSGGSRKVNKIGGRTNCFGCAIAGDATLKGRPASALNHGVTSTNDVLKFFKVSSWSVGNNQLTVTTKMHNAGNGATGVIFGHRGNGRVGHFFNVTNKNGKIQFLDFQKGGSAVMSPAELKGFKDLWFVNTTGI